MKESGTLASRTRPKTVGFLGLGRMGMPMARNLLSHGFEVAAWNRTRSRVDELKEFGAVPVECPAEVARSARIVVAMLTDLPDVYELLPGPSGLEAGFTDGSVMVLMGTHSPTGVRQLGERLAKQNVALIDAPVSGGDVGAQTATLSIMVGGADDVVAAARPVLEVLGSTVHHCGSLGAGQMAKAANQIVVAAVLVGLGEALVFAEAAGLEMELILDILSGGLAGSRALEVKREKLLSGRFEPGGAASAQLKDLRFALDEARLLEVSLNLTPVCEGLYAILCRMGGSELDHAAVVDVIRMLSSRLEPSGNYAQ